MLRFCNSIMETVSSNLAPLVFDEAFYNHTQPRSKWNEAQAFCCEQHKRVPPVKEALQH